MSVARAEWPALVNALGEHLINRHSLVESRLAHLMTEAGQESSRPAHALGWLQNFHAGLAGYPECVDG